MSTLNLVHLQDELRRQGVLMCFSGPFSHSIIEELGKAVRHYLESAQVARSALMDVFENEAAIFLIRTAACGPVKVEYCVSTVVGDFFSYTVELK